MRRFFLFLLLLVVTCIASAQIGLAKTSSKLAFTHINVVDVESGDILPDRTVLVADKRIVQVAPAIRRSVPTGTLVVDATGKYLIPGLWDMHAHSYTDKETREVFFPLFVANGITGIRDMCGGCYSVEDEDVNGAVATINKWRKEIAASKLVGPRISSFGYIVNGPIEPIKSRLLRMATPADARELVQWFQKLGVDFIKTYNQIPRQSYFALADEANKRGIPFAGHVPWAVSAKEASDLGQRSIEHVRGILDACSTDEANIRKELIDFYSTPNISDTVRNVRRSHRLRRMLDTYSDDKCQALFQSFVSNKTWKVPTLVVRRVDASLSDNAFVGDARFRYMSKQIRQEWDNEAKEQLTGATPETIANEVGWYRKSLELVGKMNQAGVQILAGSDSGDMYIVPGFHLHDELQLLVEAGLTPLQALQAATLNPAKYLNITDSLGTITSGKIADLVVLDANPLEDIHNTQKIQAVVLNGKYFDRAALNTLLVKVESLTNQ